MGRLWEQNLVMLGACPPGQLAVSNCSLWYLNSGSNISEMCQPPCYSLTPSQNQIFEKFFILHLLLNLSSYSSAVWLHLCAPSWNSVGPAHHRPLSAHLSKWAPVNSQLFSRCFSSRPPSRNVAKQEGDGLEGKGVEIIEELPFPPSVTMKVFKGSAHTG